MRHGLRLDDIEYQIRQLGLSEGDTIFVGADLLRVGYFNQTQEQTLKDWVDVLLRIVGPTGTITVPTYSPAFLRWFKNYDFIFTQETKTTSGSFSKAVLQYGDGVQRGTHPTNSCASIGAHAELIAGYDNPDLPKYTPYAKVVELGGKNLMLGTVDLRNCPFTYHLVQQNLGQITKHPYSGLFETKYVADNGEVKRFIQRELGGCTRGVHKSWGYHLAANAVTFGRVGRSVSGLVDAKKSVEILTDIMTTNPGLMRCDDKNCISCYGRYCYSGISAVKFYISQTPNLAAKLIRYMKK